MGQIRALKIGMERRIKAKIQTKSCIIEWIVEHAAMTINKHKVGEDGKTPMRRLMGREAARGIAEIGEQVMAKPRRNPQSNRKRALHSRWVHGTWVGTVAKTGEHIVVFPDGGAAIKVRTIKRVMETIGGGRTRLRR